MSSAVKPTSRRASYMSYIDNTTVLDYSNGIQSEMSTLLTVWRPWHSLLVLTLKCTHTKHTKSLCNQPILRESVKPGLAWDIFDSSSVEQSSIAHHCQPPLSLSIFCSCLKSHLFSVSYPSFWLFSHLYSAHTVTRHFGCYNRFYIKHLTFNYIVVFDSGATLSLWHCAASCFQAPVGLLIMINDHFKTDHQLTNFRFTTLDKNKKLHLHHMPNYCCKD